MKVLFLSIIVAFAASVSFADESFKPCYPNSFVQPCPPGSHPALHSEGGKVTGASASAYGFGVGGSVTRDETNHLICVPNKDADKKIDLNNVKPCPKQ